VLKHITDTGGGESRLSQPAAWGVRDARKNIQVGPVSCKASPEDLKTLGGKKQQQQSANSDELTDW